MSNPYLPDPNECPECEGTGKESPECNFCKGHGRLYNPIAGRFYDCPKCGGRDCGNCEGIGYFEGAK